MPLRPLLFVTRRVVALAATLALALVAIEPLNGQTFLLDAEVADTAYQALFNTRTAQGYRPVAITARGNPGAARFQVVWSSDASIGWQAAHGLDAAGYQAFVNGAISSGLRPLCVDAYGLPPNERYATVWTTANIGAWQARHDMTSAAYQAEFSALAAQGYRPYWVGATGSGSATRLAALWRQDGLGFQGVHDRTRSSYVAALAGAQQNGARLLSSTSYGAAGSPRFGGVWDYGSGVATTYREGMDLATLLAENQSLAGQGFRPSFVDAWDSASGVRFDAAWQQVPMQPVWTVTGSVDSNLIAFDNQMRSYMQSEGTTAAALAVMRNGRLVLARGYTWDVPGAQITEPWSRFRIASISKPLTAIAILRLVEQGLIQIDQPVAAILNMASWVDPRAQNMTVRHLLQHWGGFDRAISGDPMFRDAAISAALGQPLPTTPAMIVDFMATQNLDFTPGQRYAYSNFGYCLLGRVIEAVTGKDYEQFVLDEVLGPIGASGMRVTDSLLGQQVAEEVPYVDFGTTTSVMGGGGQVPWAYGGFNIRTMDSHGGWVASAVDLVRFAGAFDDASSSPLLSAASIDAMWARPIGWNPTDPVYYGMGWLVRDLGQGAINTWHNGSLPGTYTLMVRRSDGLNWVVLLNKRSATSGQIDGALHAAANAVTNWPSYDLFDRNGVVQSYGAGCVGALGVPVLQQMAASYPRLAGQLQVEMLPIAPSLPATLFLGFSNTSWNGVPLPASLAVLGLPGCDALAEPVASVGMQRNGERAHAALALPASAAFLGARLYAQGVALDPGAAGSLVLSNGVAATLGDL